MKRFLTFVLLLSVAVSAGAAYPEKVKKIKSPKGTTLTGVVYCGESPVEGVAVTDGREIVRTDKNGIYNIRSQKPYGLVYISTPSGYTPVTHERILPTFWAKTTLPAKKCERHDFELQQVNDAEFSIIYCTDSHLCNDVKRNDLLGFKESYMPMLQKVYNEVKDLPVYTLHLGDISWDRFWYATGFDISKVPGVLNENNYPTPIYTVMGNHDNDASVPPTEQTDFLSENCYREVFGPTFYSINIGGIHFLMLDNIIYKNEIDPKQKKQYPNVAGSRNYDLYVTEPQLEWIRKDLADVDKSTQIVVCMHGPLSNVTEDGKIVDFFKPGEREKFISVLKDYESVTIFTGHKHQGHYFPVEGYPNIVEYNTPSVCGELWHTFKNGQVVCNDGSEGGFTLCKYANGKMVNRTLYGLQSGEIPMRMYDMNSVSRYYAESKDTQILKHICELQSRQKDYSDSGYENYVYINCWYCDDNVTITAKEGDTPLEVEVVGDSDPLGTVLLLAPSMKKRKKADAKTNRLSYVDHMYRVKTATATEPVTATVTTPYGATYTLTLDRPAPFTPYLK